MATFAVQEKRARCKSGELVVVGATGSVSQDTVVANTELIEATLKIFPDKVKPTLPNPMC
jgi:hypothetical protein